MKQITIGSVSMPLSDFVVSRNAVLGITKSGKTYTAKGVAEQLLERDIPIIVFDAIGVWRYLKTPGDGSNAKGFKVVVAGGEHPDLPLTPKSAPEIVRAAIKENIPLIIDLYDAKLSKADWRRIVQSCFRILLYENKGLRHVFLEESAEFAPQKVMDGETYAEVEKLARMGGNKHVGITFINQRAQELNKAVLELCDNVILLRQRGSHAIDALEKWLDRLSPDTAKEIANSMPRMTQGDCWIFTENGEVPIRTRSGLIKSLHPDRRMPEQALHGRKSVDADSFVEKLASELPKLVEEQKENDPALLKKKIADLERQLAQTPAQAKQSANPVEVDIIRASEASQIRHIVEEMRGQRDRLNELSAQFRDTHLRISASMDRAEPYLKKLSERIARFTEVTGINKNYLSVPAQKPPLPLPQRPQPDRVPASRPALASNGDSSLGRCERSILIALAQYPQGRTRNQVAILSGYSVTSGGFNNSLSRLRTLGFINRGEPIQITSEGETALGEWQPLPTGEGLQSYWLSKLEKCEGAILGVLLLSYPDGRTKEQIGEATGYQATSGGFNNSLSKLRTLELITRGQPIKASEDFFQ